MAKALKQVNKLKRQAAKVARAVTRPKLPGVMRPARKLARHLTGK